MYIMISRLLKRAFVQFLYQPVFYEHFLVSYKNNAFYVLKQKCLLFILNERWSTFDTDPCIYWFIWRLQVKCLKKKIILIYFLREFITFDRLSKVIYAIIHSLSSWILCTHHIPPAKPEVTRYVFLNNWARVGFLHLWIHDCPAAALGIA